MTWELAAAIGIPLIVFAVTLAAYFWTNVLSVGLAILCVIFGCVITYLVGLDLNHQHYLVFGQSLLWLFVPQAVVLILALVGTAFIMD